MITKVVHGWRVGGLIAYLMGPGRAQEHVRPRVIASWDGRDAGWQPRASGPSPYDLELGPLIRAVRAPAVAAGLPEGDPDGKRGYVWHLSVRTAAGDRVLSDTEWAAVVRELLDGAGVAERGDVGGPRWVAIRHADDHVHVAVVLVRQDTGRRFWPSRDYPRLRAAARRVEARLGLTVTAAADGTAAPAASRGEREKAARRGRAPARVELARIVRSAAVAADRLDVFVEALESAGCVVAVRRAPSGDPIGYSVALAGDVNGSGRPVFYSGSKLAADLSLPRLVARWAGDGAAVSPAVAQRRAEQARQAVAAARRGVGTAEDPGGIALAAADLLTAMRGWSPEVDAAGEIFDRAARAPRGSSSSVGRAAASLRGVARALIRQRHATRSGDDPAAGGVALAVAVAALLREIAAWQREQGRAHQSAASTSAANSVTRWAGRGVDARADDAADHASDHSPVGARPRVGRSPRRRWRASRN